MPRSDSISFITAEMFYHFIMLLSLEFNSYPQFGQIKIKRQCTNISAIIESHLANESYTI